MSSLGHQLPQRSIFLFGPQAMYSLPQITAFTQSVNPLVLKEFIGNAELGWKVAYSDRLMAWYGAFWIASLVYALIRRRVRPLPFWRLILFALLTIDKVNYREARLAFYQGRFSATKNLLESIVNLPREESETESMVNDALELLLLLDANIADSAGAFLSFARAEYADAQNQSTAAVDTLENLLKHFPDSNISPQALFTVGNFLYGRLEFALALFGVFVVSSYTLIRVSRRLWN